LNKHLKAIKNLQPGECYTMGDNKQKYEIGCCYDATGFIMRGYIPAESLFYESARRENEVMSFKQLADKLNRYFGIV
jgi:hypothetical protein